MDTLTFSAPVLFRHLTFSEAKKQPISEINLKAALDGLDMTMSQADIITRRFNPLSPDACDSLWICAFSWDVTTSNP